MACETTIHCPVFFIQPPSKNVFYCLKETKKSRTPTATTQRLDKLDLEVAHKKVQALQTTFLFGWQAELFYFSISPR